MNKEIKNITSALENLTKINKSSVFKIRHDSSYPIASRSFKIEKDADNHFNYEIVLKENINNLSFNSFGFSKDFLIINEENEFKIPDFGILTMRKKRESLILNGKLSEFYTNNISENTKGFFQGVHTIEEKHLTTVFQSFPYDDNTSSYSCGLLKIEINKIPYHIYRTESKGKYYLFVQNEQLEEFKEFEINLLLIYKGIGLITGKFYNKEYYLFSSNNETFKKTNFVKYNSIGKSYLKPLQLIEPSESLKFLQSRGKKTDNLNLQFPSNVFSILIEKMKKESEFDRSIEILLEGKENDSALMRSCSYHVALETLIGFIYSKNKKEFEPIKKTENFKKLTKKLQELIDDNKENLDQLEYEVLTKKITYLNTPFNADKALKVFKILNIDLPEPLVYALKTRNKFLHGKTPYSEKEIKQNIRDLDLIADRVHLLCSIIILKYCEFKGLIKNFSGYKIAQQINIESNYEDILNEESPYYKI